MRYNVLTWDMDSAEFTPQEGMRNPCQNVDILGVKAALRELRECGYTAHRTRGPDGRYDSDPSVLVEKVTHLDE